MTDGKKDQAAARVEREALKAFRKQDAIQALTEHESSEKSFGENRERLRAERIARENAAGPMLYPAPELADDTPVENVRFSTRIRNALNLSGLKTVGEIREASSSKSALSPSDFSRRTLKNREHWRMGNLVVGRS